MLNETIFFFNEADCIITKVFGMITSRFFSRQMQRWMWRRTVMRRLKVKKFGAKRGKR